MSISLSHLEALMSRMSATSRSLTATVARQLAMPKPDDEPLDAVAFQLNKLGRLRAQAAQLVEVARGQGGSAVVAREALRRRLRSVNIAAEALAIDAKALSVRG